MKRIKSTLSEIRTACGCYLDVIDNKNDVMTESSDCAVRGLYVPINYHNEIARLFHERLLRIEDAMSTSRNTTEPAATIEEVALWEAHPTAPTSYPNAIRALIARIRILEAELFAARTDLSAINQL